MILKSIPIYLTSSDQLNGCEIFFSNIPFSYLQTKKVQKQKDKEEDEIIKIIISEEPEYDEFGFNQFYEPFDCDDDSKSFLDDSEEEEVCLSEHITS